MALDFNSQGDLHRTIKLTLEELVTHFGTNWKRKQQLDNALSLFRIFYSCGCRTVYIGGSFISKTAFPEDIDICFDLTYVNMEKLEHLFPQFFDPNQIGGIHRDQQCHIFYFTDTYPQLLNILKEDRNGNPKGLVKLSLKQAPSYDQK